MKKFLIDNKYILLSESIVILFLLHYIINGENSYITIHDFLDSNIANMSLLKYNDAILHPHNIVPVFGGIPGNWFALPYDLRLIIFSIFTPYWAIVANIYLIKSIALIGMYLLLKEFIITQNRFTHLISACVGLIFALIPFYVDYGISSAGIPLLLYAFLNLYHKRKIFTSFSCVIFYGIYSGLVLSGVFVCFLWFCFILYEYILKKHFHKLLFTGLVTLTLIYIIVNINIFLEFLFPPFISHRIEFTTSLDLKETLIEFFRIFIYSQYHAGLFFASPIILVFLILWIFKKKSDWILKYTFIWFVMLSGLILLGGLLPFIFPNIQFFTSFQCSRFYFLFPALCFIILGIVIDRCIRYHYITIAILTAGITASSCIYCDSEFRTFISSIITPDKPNNQVQPSFAQFYDRDLFDKIEKGISNNPRSDYKIACLGFYPSIAQFNQFETIDTYFYSYPLEYKHRFRQIISSELDKSNDIKTYFDNWGSRCYIFSSELGKNYLHSESSDTVVKNLDIDINALKDFKTTYLFSSVEVLNYMDLGLDLINSFTTDHSFWKIWVYKIP